MSLLEVDDLHVHFISRDRDNRIRVARVLNGVTLAVEPGQSVGLVGETGAGKSMTAQAVLGMLRPPARVVAGAIRFDSRELIGLPEPQMRRIRGKEIGLVVQSPRTSLDPLARVGTQLERLALTHQELSARDARAHAVRMLERVGFPDPARGASSWPHELSGGMAQRVLIAMALVNSPRLLIADEPTTGLDVTVQAQVLELLSSLVRERAMSLLIVTHDLGIVAHYCDKVAVMFAGRVVEFGPAPEVLLAPSHPYTQSLIAAAADRVAQESSRRPASMQPPDPYAESRGCSYSSRCSRADDRCRIEVPIGVRSASSVVHCFKPGHPERRA